MYFCPQLQLASLQLAPDVVDARKVKVLQVAAAVVAIAFVVVAAVVGAADAVGVAIVSIYVGGGIDVNAVNVIVLVVFWDIIFLGFIASVIAVDLAG